jgi:plastocyanin
MTRLATVALVSALLSAGCASGGNPSSGEPVATNQVELPKSYRFDPASIVVDAGSTVTWTNQDDFPHNVHLLDGSERTVELPLGGEGTLTFEEAGQFDYECSLHPQQMQGSVTVE